MAQNLTWHKIASSLDELHFSSNNITVVQLEGKPVCIGKFQEQFFAFAHKCPHAGGLMADGFINALGQVVCPIHRYKFDLKNGRNVSGEGYYLKHWPVECREDGVYIGREEQKWWGLF